MNFKTGKLFDVILLIALSGLIWWVAMHRVQIRDWWTFNSYQPPADIAALATDAGMNDNGRRLFYIGDPQLVDHQAIKQDCGDDIVGCVDEHDHIFLLKEDTPANHDDVVVTAAHEMLHMAYRRLSKADRQLFDPQIVIDATKYQSDIDAETSRLSDKAEKIDEEHSLLGSEYPDLSVSLETHYKLYFSDRRMVLLAYQRGH